MRHEALLSILAFSAISRAAPTRTPAKAPIRTLYNREVPQEHSHNTFLASVRTSLALDNPDNIQDSVFGLLGNAAAAAGQGSITDPDCLHQATADQAFTNAKAAGDVKGMTGALIYAALERNTGKVGLASVSCTAVEATNPEIGAISQHQDPASPGAAATNKAITLELAKQIASVGGDPQEALKSGTFAPGELDDPTAAGNSCNTIDDEPGCIFTQNLLIEDATAEEIDAAVAGAEAPAGSSASATGTSSAAISSGTGSASLDEEDSFDAPFSNQTASAAFSNDTQAEACESQKLRRRKRQAALDLGDCTDPTIKFAEGLDGRKEASFIANNQAEFPHGSAQKIGIISDFVCQKLNDKCKAGADAVAACNQGAEAAASLEGQDAADAFNAAVGGDGGAAAEVNNNAAVEDEGDDEEIGDECADASSPTSTGAAAAAASSAPAEASDAADANDNEEVEAAAADSMDAEANEEADSANNEDAAAAQGNNVQTFPGALGAPAVPVIETAGADRPFSVTANGKTDTFLNKAAALDRSCAVQKNACANAANGGQIEESVADCEVQQQKCNAAAA
ncbi:MAG: hypothetical protein Q9169_006124 [Polycauliona sp. 2 TL-2023]